MPHVSNLKMRGFIQRGRLWLEEVMKGHEMGGCCINQGCHGAGQSELGLGIKH